MVLKQKLLVQISFTIHPNPELAGVLARIMALSIPFKPKGVSTRDYREYKVR